MLWVSQPCRILQYAVDQLPYKAPISYQIPANRLTVALQLVSLKILYDDVHRPDKQLEYAQRHRSVVAVPADLLSSISGAGHADYPMLFSDCSFLFQQ